MDEGIRSGKSLSLGMPDAPQGNIRDSKASKLGGAPEGIPSFFYQLSVILLAAIFLFITWYVFCLECHVLYESLLFLLLFERNTHYSWFFRILYVLHLHLLGWPAALVLHLKKFRAWRCFYFKEIVVLSCFTYIFLRVDNSNGN